LSRPGSASAVVTPRPSALGRRRQCCLLCAHVCSRTRARAARAHTRRGQCNTTAGQGVRGARVQAKGGSFVGDNKDFYRFRLGERAVIPAFEEAVQTMKVCTQRAAPAG